MVPCCGGMRAGPQQWARCWSCAAAFLWDTGKSTNCRSQDGELAAGACSAFSENQLVLVHPNSNHHIGCPDRQSLGKCLCTSHGPQDIRSTGDSTECIKPLLFCWTWFLLRVKFVHGVVIPSMARNQMLLHIVALSQPLFSFRIIPQLENSPSQVSPSSLPGSEISEATRTYLQGMSRYDLDELDACWLELVNMELKEMGEYCFYPCLGIPAWAFGLSK